MVITGHHAVAADVALTCLPVAVSFELIRAV